MRVDLVVAAVAAVASANAPMIGVTSPGPTQISYETRGWGQLIFGWTVDEMGHARLSWRRPGVNAITGVPVDTSYVDVGPEGYAWIEQRIAVAQLYLRAPLPCIDGPIPLPTDHTEGTIVWKHGGAAAHVAFPTECQRREAKSVYQALEAIKAYFAARVPIPTQD
jgi:hypothetical protein